MIVEGKLFPLRSAVQRLDMIVGIYHFEIISILRSPLLSSVFTQVASIYANGTKESVCIIKEFNSHRTRFGH